MSEDKLPIRPVGGNILVLPIEDSSKITSSGLVIASRSSEESTQFGEIIALGTGLVRDDGSTIPWGVNAGDKIAFKKYSPDELEFEGKKYLIMKEADILVIINN